MGNEAEELEIEGTEKPIAEGEAVVEPELDAEGNPVKPEVEAWMQVDDPEKAAEPGKEVVTEPLKKPTQKQKLRARLDGANDENEQLKARISELEKGKTAEVAGSLKRPDREDFDNFDDFVKADDAYSNQKETAKASASEMQSARNRVTESRQSDVVAHYARADELIEASGMSPEVYQAADKAFLNAVAAERKDYGEQGIEQIVEEIISALGEGSEKTIAYVGRNKTLINEFRTILRDDKSGLKALVFLTKQGAKISGTKKSISQAAKPVAQINGETVTAPASKKAYDKAHKEGRGQDAYNIKSEAKRSGVDTKAWVLGTN